VQQAPGTAIDVTAAQFSQTVFRSGSGTDQLWARANDGTDWSVWTAFTVTAPVNRDPSVLAADRLVSKGEVFAASRLFIFNDADGDTATRYEFWDATPGQGSFSRGGTGQAIAVTAAQLGSLSFTAAQGGLSEIPCMAVRLNDTLMPWPG